MHILVPIHRVVDHNVNIRVKADGSGVDLAGVRMSMNPFDEVALEQAVRCREQGRATQITAVACGAAVTQDVLRTALALGADAAVLIESPAPLDALAWARLLHTWMQQQAQPFDLVLCGQQVIDDDLGALAPMLAGLLDWPQATGIHQLTLPTDPTSDLHVACEGDQGTEQWALPLPAVLSVDLRLCDPRHITLPQMMKAKKAPLTRVATSDLGSPQNAPTADPDPWAAVVHLSRLHEPPRRAPGRRLPTVQALIDALRQHPAVAA